MNVLEGALSPDSELRGKLCAGMQAVKSSHRGCFDAEVRADFSGSLDLDATLAANFPNTPRWDYLLGHSPSGELVAVEPHPYRDGG